MIYAVNLFNLKGGAEADYRRYAIEASGVLRRVGATVVAAGRDPLRLLAGDILREWFIVVEFPDERAFSDFLSSIEAGPLHGVRERLTSDYIWTVYEPWPLAQWANTPA